MYKHTYLLLLLLIVPLIFLSASCKKEDLTARTWETEMAELEKELKNLEAEGVDIDTTNLLVYYYVMKKGEGPLPNPGDSCYVSYTGFLPEGNAIERSTEIYSPKGVWGFIYEPPHTVKGFVNGIGYMNEGAEIQMYITSDLAYGKKGTSNVPPYTTLIYRAKMHRLKPAD